ncbi:5-methylcytosine restriction system specificity protein McrC [Enterococcus alishanensis]
MIQLEDNSKVKEEFTDNPIIEELVDRDLSNLERDGFIIFPPTINDSVDLEKENYLFRRSNQHIWTSNLIGVFKKGSDELQINSRFYDSEEGNRDFFLRYLLQKVMNINVNRTKINIDSQLSYYDLLAYLFPMYLDEAMRKGNYKEYVSKKYNDSNIKGQISIARHIKCNTPFMGKIAYDTREFSYDNNLTQLIRHTIEKLQLKFSFDSLVTTDFKENVREVINITPSYSRLDRDEIIKGNVLNPVKHGYFEEYSLLQKLCIQILNEEHIGFGDEEDEAHGIIIDVAWLWEEYLATLLKPKFTHAENKTRKNPIYFYTDNKNPRYPDFYSDSVILDAKYKQLDKNNKGISREDLYQMTSYLHVLKASSAGVIYPSQKDNERKSVGTLAGFGGEIFKVGFTIPQVSGKYADFEKDMKDSEEKFLSEIQC